MVGGQLQLPDGTVMPNEVGGANNVWTDYTAEHGA